MNDDIEYHIGEGVVDEVMNAMIAQVTPVAKDVTKLHPPLIQPVWFEKPRIYFPVNPEDFRTTL